MGPALSETWNDLVFGIFTEGKDFVMKEEMTGMYEKILGIELPEKINVLAGFNLLAKEIRRVYKDGVCSRLML